MSFTENQTTFQIENANDGLIEVGKRLTAAMFMYLFQRSTAGKESNDKR